MAAIPKKIALIGYKLSNGGAERVLSETSFILENAGYEVHVIIMIDEVTYPYAGKLLNLGVLRSKKNGTVNKFNRYKTLRNYIVLEKFDALIDFRFRVNILQELLIYKLYKGIKIQTVNSGKYENYLFENKWLSERIFSQFDKIVCISKKQLEKIEQERHFQNLVIIPNPIDITKISLLQEQEIVVDFPYILAVGRLFPEKQFDQLVKAYAKSVLPQKGIRLLIIGQGYEKSKIQKAIDDSAMSQMVHLLGFQHNPYPYYKHAYFLVQSSLYEGLPMVLLEALATGTPVVAFDCFSGPSEIIRHQQNGWLVEDQNFEALTEAMNIMYQDTDLYQLCKANAIKSISRFSPENVGKKWISLLSELFDKNKKSRP